MIQVTLNLENEHVLAEDVKGLFASLTTEQVQDIAQKALFKYLTDSIDYEKEVYIQNAVAESRKLGIPNRSSYTAKSREDVADMSDEAIVRTEAFKEKYLNNYKSPKESRFDEINKIINEEVREKAKQFVSSNNELATLVSDKQNKIAENFEVIIKDTITSILGALVVGTMTNANVGVMGFNQNQNIVDILNRHNLY